MLLRSQLTELQTQTPHWFEDDLENARQAALTAFVAERGREGTQRYEELFAICEQAVELLFQETNDLLRFEGKVLRANPTLIAVARYLAAPPISQDDLNTLAGGTLAGRKRIGEELAERAVLIVRAAWDPIRFPWVSETRSPTDAEKLTAIRWTAGIWAVEVLRTERRGQSSKRQETVVVAGLERLGWQLSPLRRVGSLDELPRGSFSREAQLAGSKCDVPVRLQDGRLLAIECKVSNSAINSVKRLNREVGGKADQWRRAFGEQVIPAAVLAGVFKLGNLIDAQERQRVAIFWEHDLESLFDFVKG